MIPKNRPRTAPGRRKGDPVVSLTMPVSLALMGEKGTRAVARIASASPMLQPRRTRGSPSRGRREPRKNLELGLTSRPAKAASLPVGKQQEVLNSYVKAEQAYDDMKRRAVVHKLPEPEPPGGVNRPPATSHEQSHDILLLDRWVGGMLALEKGEMEQSQGAWLSFFKEQRKRYSLVMEELARQTAPHSGRLARLFTKVWAGDSLLHDKLLDAYEHALGSTVFLQGEMRNFAQGSERYATFARHDYNRMALELARTKKELMESKATVVQLSNELDYYHDENLRIRTMIVSYIDPNFIGGLAHPKAPPRGAVRKELERKQQQEEALAAAIKKGDPLALAKASKSRAEELLAKAESIYADEPPPPSSDQALDLVRPAVHEHEKGLHAFDHLATNKLSACEAEGEKQEKLVRQMKGMVSAVAKLAMEQAEKLAYVPTSDADTQTEELVEAEEERGEDDPPPCPSLEKKKTNSAAIPKGMRKLMGAFPKCKRVLGKKNLQRLILHIYLDKIISDEAHDNVHSKHLPLGDFVYQFLMNKYGLRTLADWHTTQLIASVVHYGTRSELGIRHFADMTGALKPEKPPLLTLRDQDFFFTFLKVMQQKGEFTAALLQDTDMQIDVSKIGTKEAVKELFEVLPTGNLMSQLNNLSPPSLSQSPKHWDLDEVIKCVMEQWEAVNASWRLQLELLFQKYATVYYHDDEGNAIQVARNEVSAGMDSFGLLTFEGFESILADVDHMLPPDQVRDLFAATCEKAKKDQTEAHAALWKKAEDPESSRQFYYNTQTGETSWERPYDPQDFDTQEVDCDCLVEAVFTAELLEHSWTGPIRSAEVPEPPQHMLEYYARRKEREAAAAAFEHQQQLEHDGYRGRDGSTSGSGAVRGRERSIQRDALTDRGRDGSVHGSGAVRGRERSIQRDNLTGRSRERSVQHASLSPGRNRSVQHSSQRSRGSVDQASPTDSRPASAATTVGGDAGESRPASAATIGAPSRPASAMVQSLGKAEEESPIGEPVEGGQKKPSSSKRPTSAAPRRRPPSSKGKKGSGSGKSKKTRPASAAPDP